MRIAMLFLVCLMFSTSAFAQGSCQLFANTPDVNQNARLIFGSGGRGSLCSSSTNVRVYLKQDRRFWFDKTLASRSQSGANVTLNVQYKCKGNGHQKVYIETRGDGDKVQSPRRAVHYCS